MATASEGWKRSGLLRGPGIPTPSGQFSVGCVDLMHKFEDEPHSLLVRLFYPCQEGDGGGRYQYAQWTPHKRYTKGYMDYKKTKMSGILSFFVRVLTEPKIPALYGAPLLTTEATTTVGPQEVNPETPAVPTEGVKTEETVDPMPETSVDAPPTSNSPVEATPTSELPAEATPTSDFPTETTPTAEPPTFPVIVFSHGLGAMRTAYCAICCDLASHGYIVASVDHRDRSASVTMRRVPKPGGRDGELQDDWLEHYHLQDGEKEFPVRNQQVKQRAVDAKKALDLLGLLNDGMDVGNLLGADFDFHQFKGRMDMSTAAIMGHSFGGATTVQTLSEDQRFKCGLGLDTWMLPIHRDLYESVQQPLMFINSFNFQWKENIQQMTKLTKPENEDGISPCRIVTLKDTNHYYQTDVLFVVPSVISGKALSPLDPAIGHQVNMDICRDFLKRHLLKDPAYQGPSPNLDGREGHSEHILFGTNVDITEEPEEAGQGDQVTPPEGGVTSEGDQLTPPEEGVASEDDQVTPQEECVASEGDQVTPQEECVASEGDQVTPPEGGVASEGDQVTPSKEGVASDEATEAPVEKQVGVDNVQVNDENTD